MAAYTFEELDQPTANTFKAGDALSFAGSPNSRMDIDDDASKGTISLTLTTLDGVNGPILSLKTLSFPIDAFSAASQQGHIQFSPVTLPIFGTEGNDTLSRFGADPGIQGEIFAFGGDDTIYGGGGLDFILGGAGNDYINGETGPDQLHGGDGNDHIYGNSISSVQGAGDGNDTIFGDAGNDYIQGNSDNDRLSGGEGNDRIFGGGGSDIINGDAGSDTINGNNGNDTIYGDEGNDILRGGQLNDSISGGSGNDIIYGDLGDDTMAGDVGYDVLFGGDGADIFRFGGPGDAPTGNIGNAAAGALVDVVDVIGDFAPGVDRIDLVSDASTTILTGKADTVKAALDYAQQLIDGNNAGANVREVAAIAVGSDTYVFAIQGDGTTIDTAIKLVGVSPSALTASDFI